MSIRIVLAVLVVGISVATASDSKWDSLRHFLGLDTRQLESQIEFGPICVGRSYKIFIHALTWDQARQACEDDGGMLARIPERAIHRQVKDYIFSANLEGRINSEAGKGLWIGLNDRAEEGHYVWADGEELNINDCNLYTGWADNEPNNNEKKDPNGQDCVQLWKNRNFDWDDGYCDRTPKGYICEYKDCRDECVACL